MPLLACSPHYWLSGSSLVSLGAKQSKQRLSVDLPIATGRLARNMPTCLQGTVFLQVEKQLQARDKGAGRHRGIRPKSLRQARRVAAYCAMEPDGDGAGAVAG